MHICMGLFGRSRQKPDVPRVLYRLIEGTKALEVVGESHYQDNLWHIVGRDRDQNGRVRQAVIAALVPDPNNQYDSRAVAVHIDRALVGHLPRTTASLVFAPLASMYQQINQDERIAVRGEVVGGSDGDDGRLGQLGVFLKWDPEAFGITDLPHGTNPSAGSWTTSRSSKVASPTDATLAKTAERLGPVIAETVTKAQAEALVRSLDALQTDLQALADDLTTIGVDAGGKLLAQRLARFGFTTHDSPASARYIEDLGDELDQLLGALEDLVDGWAGANREDREALRWEASGGAADLVDRINERSP